MKALIKYKLNLKDSFLLVIENQIWLLLQLVVNQFLLIEIILKLRLKENITKVCFPQKECIEYLVNRV